jgi:competence protein ComEC
MVASSPAALTSLSFQLSLLATIGVVLGARCTAHLSHAMQVLLTPIATTAIVGLTTAPVVAMWFGTFTPAMIPANVLAAPLAAPATLLAVAVCVLAPVPMIADIAGWAAWLACSAVLAIARACSGTRYSQLTFAPIAAEGALTLYAVGLLGLAAFLPEGRVVGRALANWAVHEPRPATVAALTLVAMLCAAVLTS